MNLILPISILEEIIQEKEIGITEAISEHERHIQLREEKIKELRYEQADDIRSLKGALYQLQKANSACFKCNGKGAIEEPSLNPFPSKKRVLHKCKECLGTGNRQI